MKINLKKFGKIVTNDLLGVEFEKSHLKIIQMKVLANHEEIVNIFQKDISGLSDTEISNIILSKIDTLSLKSPEVVDIITPSFVITKNIEVPSVDMQEIKEIVNLQASRHTPYSREEIIVDFLNLGTYRRNYTRILLVIVNRSVIKRHFDILSKAGIALEKVVFSAEAVALSLARLFRIETTDNPCGIIHMDEDNTDFIIVLKDKPIFIRQIPVGAKQLVFEKEKYQLRFIEEIRRSKEAYLAEDVGKLPSNFILTGGIEALSDLERILDVPLERVSYLNNLRVSQEVLKDVSLNKNISFLNTVSGLLVKDKLKIDLIPEEIKLKRALQLRAKELLKSGILVLTIFIILFFILLNKIYFKSMYLKNLDKKYRVLEEEAKQLEEDFSRLSLVKSYLAKRGLSLEVLSEIYDLLPEEIELSYIRFEEAGKFSIRGNAVSMSLVFNLVDSLEKSAYFKDVKTRYTTKRKIAGKDMTDFEIVGNLEKPS